MSKIKSPIDLCKFIQKIYNELNGHEAEKYILMDSQGKVFTGNVGLNVHEGSLSKKYEIRKSETIE